MARAVFPTKKEDERALKALNDGAGDINNNSFVADAVQKHHLAAGQPLSISVL